MKQNSCNDPSERERLLATYAGIFPRNIKEFGDTVAKNYKKPKTNFSR